jgi:hypothetical protein
MRMNDTNVDETRQSLWRSAPSVFVGASCGAGAVGMLGAALLIAPSDWTSREASCYWCATMPWAELGIVALALVAAAAVLLRSAYCRTSIRGHGLIGLGLLMCSLVGAGAAGVSGWKLTTHAFVATQSDLMLADASQINALDRSLLVAQSAGDGQVGGETCSRAREIAVDAAKTGVQTRFGAEALVSRLASITAEGEQGGAVSCIDVDLASSLVGDLRRIWTRDSNIWHWYQGDVVSSDDPYPPKMFEYLVAVEAHRLAASDLRAARSEAAEGAQLLDLEAREHAAYQRAHRAEEVAHGASVLWPLPKRQG